MGAVERDVNIVVRSNVLTNNYIVTGLTDGELHALFLSSPTVINTTTALNQRLTIDYTAVILFTKAYIILVRIKKS